MIKLIRLLLITFLPLFLLSSACRDDNKPTKRVNVHIILGQANGIGKADPLTLPKELNDPLQGSYIYNSETGNFENIHAGFNTQSGPREFGPVVRAAYQLRRYTNKESYFIVIGVDDSQLYNSGSSAIKDWHPNSNEILAETKQTIEKARIALMSQDRKPVFKTITWWQGESDALTEQKALAYQANEEALFRSLDLIPYLQNTKRIVFKIFNESGPYAGLINEAKAARARTDSRTIAVIETQDYARIQQNPLYASTEGQLKAGLDLFNILKTVR